MTGEIATGTRRKSMSSKPKRNGSTGAEAVSTQAATIEEIRRRAYQLYLERGEQHGRDLDDWLQAKRELEGGALGPEQAG
jgi:Protein of unknown function (DUF2934)